MNKKIKIKIGATIIIVLICGFLGGLVMGYQGVFSKQLSFLVKTAEGEVSIKDSLTAEQVEEKIKTYIREEFLGKDGPEIFLATSTTFQNGVYKLNFKIQDTEIPSVYATKDGNLFFPEGKEIISLEEKQSVACESIKKAEQPMLEAFVVSYCP
jgi:5-hydroxyisourate hydrolase-like protein (transthyretin family)